MITPEIISYIREEQEKKTPDSVIRSNLLANGWNMKDIDEAFLSLTMPFPQNVAQSPQNKKLDAKFQNDRKWTIFYTYAVLDLLLTITTFSHQASLSLPSDLVISLLLLLFIYPAAYVVSRGARPNDKKWKDVVELIASIIGAGFLIMLIGIGLFFVTCIYQISHG